VYERLYDLETDPDETRDVSEAHPLELERHRAFLRAYTAKASHSTPAAPNALDAEIDARTRERLRSLGYLD
jgi:hypothetical protein